MHITLLTLQAVDLIARAGGGGSSSGGSGGGGGIFALGYLASYYPTSYLNKRVSRRAALLVGIAVTVLMLGGLFGLSPGIAIGMGVAGAVGVYSALHNMLGRMLNRAKKTKQQVDMAAATDPVWQEARIKERVSAVFQRYQYDWSNFDFDSMKTYLKPDYAEHMRLVLTALWQMGRRNVVSSPVMLSGEVIAATDADDDDHDYFEFYIQAQADDVLQDSKTGAVINRDTSTFEEIWQLDREGDDWFLQGIKQVTEAKQTLDPTLEAFAKTNGMYYSPDWGRLLLPQRGQLFGKAQLSRSDINNHVIGEWNGLIVQLYTYVPLPALDRADNYLIAQINLPKSYGGIIVRRRSGFGLWRSKPNGYQELSLEWPDFNKRYQVLATDINLATSFELLNPGFMARLYDMDLKVDIEVVDNLVYLHSLVRGTGRYPEMLTVLQMAYKELKR